MTESDICLSNGKVHIVDHVLSLPPGMVDRILSLPEQHFSRLRQGINQATFIDDVKASSSVGCTFFAPNDEAFEAFGRK